MTNDTTRLARISADTGLSIDEAESYLKAGFINFDPQTGKYFVDFGDQPKPVIKSSPKRLSKAELRWLTK